MISPRVLIVEDERFFREAMRESLAAAGIPCETAESGEEALKRATDPGVGVAVLDLSVADLEGLEVLRTLRRERPSLRVVVLSAPTDQELVLEALRLEACDYLAKPLHDEELVLCVRRALAQHALEERFEGLRDRLAELCDQSEELTARAAALAPGERRRGLAQAGAEAAAALTAAAKTSVLLLEAEAEAPLLRVVGQTGRALPAEEMDAVPVGGAVAGLVAASGEVLAAEDVEAEPWLAAQSSAHRYASRACALVPVGGGPVLGVICATDRPGGAPFAEAELALLRILAQQLAALLAAGAPVGTPAPAAEATAADRDAEIAREICDALTAEVEPARVLPAALRPIARALPAGPVSLYLLDPESSELVLEAEVAGETRGDEPRLPRGRGLCGAVLESGRLVATDHPERDPRFDPEVDTPLGNAVGPLLCVPLRLRGVVLGVARAFPLGGAQASPRSGEVLAAALSAAVRNVLLYRSLLESIDEVARARQEGAAGGGA